MAPEIEMKGNAMTASPEMQRQMLRRMQTIRRFEERASDDYHSGDIYGVVHCYIGEEAVAVGVCSALRDDDQIISNHRGHGHCIAKGADLNRMMAELYGRQDGFCKGKGGSMHIADFSIGMLGANGIVGGGISIITGAGLAAQMEGSDVVAVGFFGDGASSQGTLHESMNLASIWDLPGIFVCENNRYAESTPFEYSVAGGSVSNRAEGYVMPGVTVDGQSVLDVFEVAKEAVARARSGKGPTLIEAQTYRYLGHAGHDDPLTYRSEEEQSFYMDRDCITSFRRYILDGSFADEDELDNIDLQCQEKIAVSVQYADDSPFPDDEELTKDVYNNYS